MDSCEACGASNSLDSKWCGQCFAPLGVKTKEHEVKAEPVGPIPAVRDEAPTLGAAVTAVSAPESLAPNVDQDPTWTCLTCGKVVLLDVDTCPVCGTTIYENFESPAERKLLSSTERAKQALVPGREHGSAISWVAGVVIFMVVLMSLLFGLMLVGASGGGAGFFVLVWGLGIWGFSIWDAHQSAFSLRYLLQPSVAVIAGVVPILVIIATVITRVRT